jgi:hypothetical protein
MVKVHKGVIGESPWFSGARTVMHFWAFLSRLLIGTLIETGFARIASKGALAKSTPSALMTLRLSDGVPTTIR